MKDGVIERTSDDTDVVGVSFTLRTVLMTTDIVELEGRLLDWTVDHSMPWKRENTWFASPSPQVCKS